MATQGPEVVNGTLQPLINPGLNNLVDSQLPTGFIPPSIPTVDAQAVAGTVTPAPLVALPGLTTPNDDTGISYLLNGTIAPEGFLVTPHAAPDGSLTALQVRQILFNGVIQAIQTRAAIRLPLDSSASMVLSVTDKEGQVLGQFRMPDSTIFSIDVSVAKARNAAYYANPAALQPIDQLPGIPAGTALSAPRSAIWPCRASPRASTAQRGAVLAAQRQPGRRSQYGIHP